MTTKEAKTKIANKKVMLLPAVIGAIVAGLILAAIFMAYPELSSVYAVQPFNSTTSGMGTGSSEMPKIVGSINTVQATKNVIKDNLKVSFIQAADTAARQITNGSLVGGHLGVVQGYLVYIFYGVNPETHTLYHRVVDAGNGKVLYASPGQKIGAGGFFGRLGALEGPFGPVGQHVFAGGPEHMPLGIGPWRAPEGFMSGDGIWH